MDGLNWLIKQLVRAGHVDYVRLEGLREDRRAVIGGGASVLRALMQLLDIEKLDVAQGALRQGVLFEMVERDDHATDVRDISIQRLAQKFTIDQTQSQRVSRVALQLFSKAIANSEFDNPLVQNSNASSVGPPLCMKWALPSRIPITTSMARTFWKTLTCWDSACKSYNA